MDEPVQEVAAAIGREAAVRAAHPRDLSKDQIGTLASWSTTIVSRLRHGGTLFSFGNGGSTADAEHLAAELVGRYRRERQPLAAIALTTNASAVTAISNDYGFDEVFARQVHGLVRAGDVVLGISTSGRSPNVRNGLSAAGHVGALRLALLGGVDQPIVEEVTDLTDSVLLVDPAHTPSVQELHRLAMHLLCAGIEAALDEPLPDSAEHELVAASASRVVSSAEEALGIVDGWRAAGHRIATTNGGFDLLHEGHVASLTDARAQADHLVVLCNTDRSVRHAKGPERPVVPFEQRATVLAGLRAVDLVIPLDDEVPTRLLGQLRPDVHVKGAEYELSDLPEADTVIAGGGRIHRSPMVPGRSTTALVDRVTRQP